MPCFALALLFFFFPLSTHLFMYNIYSEKRLCVYSSESVVGDETSSVISRNVCKWLLLLMPDFYNHIQLLKMHLKPARIVNSRGLVEMLRVLAIGPP